MAYLPSQHPLRASVVVTALNDVHEYIEQLLSEIHQLRKNLLDVETSKSEMECQIRQEMAEAMEDRLHHVETFYRQLMDQQMMAAEEKLEKKVELFEREAQRQVECAASDGVRFSSKDWENFKSSAISLVTLNGVIPVPRG